MVLRNFRWLNGFEEPIAPDPVTSPPFSYGANTSYFDEDKSPDVFKMDDIAQATHRELCRFLKGKTTEKAPKRWLTTQLTFYGIPFKRSATVSDLKKILEKALKDGKCEELAPSIAAVRDRL
jgi:hypothetical protein